MSHMTIVIATIEYELSMAAFFNDERYIQKLTLYFH
jgi:hypothetical protein